MENKIFREKFYMVLTASLVMSFLMLVSACSQNKSKGNNQQAYPPPISSYPNSGYPNSGFSNCANCANMGQMGFLMTADSENVRGSLYMGLDYYGAANGGFDFNNPQVPTFYNGLVQAHGRLQVRSVDRSLCNAPMGDYEVFTITPGTWRNGVTNLRLEARGNGISLFVSFIQGIMYMGTSRMGGTFLVEAINGQDCRMLTGSVLTLELF